jgi:hypothetical protein
MDTCASIDGHRSQVNDEVANLAEEIILQQLASAKNF